MNQHLKRGCRLGCIQSGRDGGICLSKLLLELLGNANRLAEGMLTQGNDNHMPLGDDGRMSGLLATHRRVVVLMLGPFSPRSSWR